MTLPGRNNPYLRLVRDNRDYRLLWLGAVFSYGGDWFNLIASADLVASLSERGAAISYLFLARFLPSFVFSPLAGVLADRLDRRRLLIAADIFRAVTVMGFLLVRRADQLWLFYLLLVLQFIGSTIFIPARSAMVAMVVDRRSLVTANAVDSLTWSMMLTVGALLGGVVAGRFGRETAFVVDATTFLVSALLIARIGARPPRPMAGQMARGALAFWEGLRYVWGAPFILAVSLAKAGGALAWSAINVLEVTFARQTFPLGAGGAMTLGLIYTVTGIGTGVGPVLARAWLGDEATRLRWGIALGFASLSGGVLILATAPNLEIFLLGGFVRTLGSGTLWVFSSALLQLSAPDAFRGRVFAFEYAALTLAQSASTLWAGLAQDQLGWSATQVALAMAGLAVVTGGVWLVGHLYWLRHPQAAGVTEAATVGATEAPAEWPPETPL